MKKIFRSEEAAALCKKLHNENKKIVVAGGCFDILHIGHITFLSQAKTLGDMLFILLESDVSIQKMKGEHRPINTQIDRAKVLEALSVVDGIILLEGILQNEDYDELILAMKPAIIATNGADPNAEHKKRQAEKSGSTVVNVGESIQNKSTTHLAKLLQNEL